MYDGSFAGSGQLSSCGVLYLCEQYLVKLAIDTKLWRKRRWPTITIKTVVGFISVKSIKLTALNTFGEFWPDRQSNLRLLCVLSKCDKFWKKVTTLSHLWSFFWGGSSNVDRCLEEHRTYNTHTCTVPGVGNQPPASWPAQTLSCRHVSGLSSLGVTYHLLKTTSLL